MNFFPAIQKHILMIVVTGIIVFAGCSKDKTTEHNKIIVSGIVTHENRPVSYAKIYLVIPGITFNDRHCIETKTHTQDNGSFSFLLK